MGKIARTHDIGAFPRHRRSDYEPLPESLELLGKDRTLERVRAAAAR